MNFIPVNEPLLNGNEKKYLSNCIETGWISSEGPFVKKLEPYPINPNRPDGKWPPGNCWPAGHASGGFALLSLYLVFKDKKKYTRKDKHRRKHGKED